MFPPPGYQENTQYKWIQNYRYYYEFGWTQQTLLNENKQIFNLFIGF